MNKTILLLIGFALALSVNACAPPQDVPLDELLSNPDRYNGRQVCTKGIYATGFEVNAIAASVRNEGNVTYLTEPIMWLEGADVTSSSHCFESATSPLVRFCEARVCGVFESGDNYGHLGGYAYQLGAGDQEVGHDSLAFRAVPAACTATIDLDRT